MQSSHYNNTQEAQLEPPLPLCCSQNCVFPTGLLYCGDRKCDGAVIVVWLKIKSVGNPNLIEKAPVHLTIISCNCDCVSHTDPVCSLSFLCCNKTEKSSKLQLPNNYTHCPAIHKLLWRAGAYDRSLVRPDEAAALRWLSLHSTYTWWHIIRLHQSRRQIYQSFSYIKKTQHTHITGSPPSSLCHRPPSLLETPCDYLGKVSWCSISFHNSNYLYMFCVEMDESIFLP